MVCIPYELIMVCENWVFGVFDQVRLKPVCTITEEGKRLDISDLRRREIVLSVNLIQRCRIAGSFTAAVKIESLYNYDKTIY